MITCAQGGGRYRVKVTEYKRGDVAPYMEGTADAHTKHGMWRWTMNTNTVQATTTFNSLNICTISRCTQYSQSHGQAQTSVVDSTDLTQEIPHSPNKARPVSNFQDNVNSYTCTKVTIVERKWPIMVVTRRKGSNVAYILQRSSCNLPHPCKGWKLLLQD